MAYTTAAKVAAHLGRALTADQQTQVTSVLEPAAKAWIDRYTGASWEVTSPVSAELHAIEGPSLYLQRAPVAAITSIAVRPPYAGSTAQTLPATAYELTDAATGLVTVSGYAGWLATVTYTFSPSPSAVPADVGLAATLLVAHWLTDTLQPERLGLESLNLAQGELNMRFDQRPVPDAVTAILNARRALVFA